MTVSRLLGLVHPVSTTYIFAGWRILHLLALLLVNNWHQEARGCLGNTVGKGLPWNARALCSAPSSVWPLCSLKQSGLLSNPKSLCSPHTVFYSRKHSMCTELAQWEYSPRQHSNTNVAQVLQKGSRTTNCQRRLKFKFLHLSRCLLFLHK